MLFLSALTLNAQPSVGVGGSGQTKVFVVSFSDQLHTHEYGGKSLGKHSSVSQVIHAMFMASHDESSS